MRTKRAKGATRLGTALKTHDIELLLLLLSYLGFPQPHAVISRCQIRISKSLGSLPICRALVRSERSINALDNHFSFNAPLLYTLFRSVALRLCDNIGSFSSGDFFALVVS